MNIVELNKKAWNALAADTAWPYSKHEKYLRMFKAFCNALNKEANVLDIGCGPGVPVTRALVDCGFHVTGIDFSEQMLARAAVNVP
jgi:ubiquinone/menaquinone biosynthesis C-methylase UbiE